MNGECEDCEPYYNLVCLRPSGHSHDDLSTCSLGSFNPGASDIPRMVSITGTEPWPVSGLIDGYCKERSMEIGGVNITLSLSSWNANKIVEVCVKPQSL